MAQRFRNWCFTINNPDDRDYSQVRTVETVCKGWQTEIGGSGTPHIQGWLVLKNARTLKGLKKDLTKAHLEPMKGTIQDSITYCSKPEGMFIPYEQIGDLPPGQGARTDLKELGERIRNGETTVKKILEEDPTKYHQYGRTLEKLAGLAERKKHRTWQTRGIWIWGPSGVGKSHRAFEGYSDETHYIWQYDDKGWQEDYDGQETIIMDELRQGKLKYEDLLRLLDKYPMKLSQRGKAPVAFLGKTIIITSSLPPEDIYRMENTKDSLAQLLRRIEIVHLTEKFNTNEGAQE